MLKMTIGGESHTTSKNGGSTLSDWSTIQARYKPPPEEPAQNKGTKWTTNIMQLLWKWCLQVWEDRNLDVHGNDKKMRMNKEKQRLRRRLRQIHVLHDKVCMAHREYFLADNLVSPDRQ